MQTKIVLAVAAVASLAAAPQAGAKPGAYNANQCFYTRDVTNFAAPDEHNLYVRVGVGRVYHFEMFGPCPDIDWNQRLALVSRGSSWICDAMDAEVVTHSPGLGRQRCFVRHMRQLTPEEIAALPKRARP